MSVQLVSVSGIHGLVSFFAFIILYTISFPSEHNGRGRIETTCCGNRVRIAVQTVVWFPRISLTVERAGVIGLQTGIALLQARLQVTIVAQYRPGEVTIEYTSPW